MQEEGQNSGAAKTQSPQIACIISTDISLAGKQLCEGFARRFLYETTDAPGTDSIESLQSGKQGSCLLKLAGTGFSTTLEVVKYCHL